MPASSEPASPPDPSSNRDFLEAYLASHDALCPRCTYNLRGSSTDRCPECGLPLSLVLSDDDPRSRWDILALFAVVLTVLYFAVRTTIFIINLADGAYRDPILAPYRIKFAISASIETLIAVGGSLWCLAILRNRHRRPRPIWARPTTAATGLLLAVFVAFLLYYGVSALL
jgi:hypothetical protein